MSEILLSESSPLEIEGKGGEWQNLSQAGITKIRLDQRRKATTANVEPLESGPGYLYPVSDFDPAVDDFSCFIMHDDADNVWNVEEPNPSNFKPPSTENKFRVGHRLEAVDRRNPDLVCVASVKGVSGDKVLIHFDGWNRNYDYFCHHRSPELRPIGSAKRLGMTLHIPNPFDLSNKRWYDGGGTWDGYLAQIGAIAAPNHSFGPLYSPQQPGCVSLQELSVRTFLRHVTEDALEQLDTSPDTVLANFPKPVQAAVLSCRCCCWCGGPFVQGFNCVLPFTSQLWLATRHAAKRLATTCSRDCAKSLVSHSWGQVMYNGENGFGVNFFRLYYIART